MFSFDDLPAPGGRRLAVRVRPAAQRELRSGHPWLFDGGIDGDVTGAAGDLAVVFDAKRKFLAVGLFDPTSPIRVRVLQHRTPATIDDTWWHATIDRALDRRASLTKGPATTGYRMVNGENDSLPGLIVDRYESVAVVKLYSAAWLPHLSAVVRALVEANADRSLHLDTVVVRLARSVQRQETFGLRDGMAFSAATLEPVTLVEPVVFSENGLRFESAPRSGQKTGYFLDQRDNRRRVGALSAGASVLDVFSCTGGFSVYAAAGGARSVHAIDLAPEAIATAARNFEANRDQVGDCELRTSVVDAFEAMAAMADRGERFDVVVIDPPSFAHKQSDVVRAMAAYRRLTRLGLRLVEPGGLLVQASCSSRIPAHEFFALVRETAAAEGDWLTDVTETGHAIDHPITFTEGAYLKAVFARVNADRPRPLH